MDDVHLYSKVVPLIACGWYDVGVRLGIPSDKLNDMKQITRPTGIKCLQMLKTWVSTDDPDRRCHPTWGKLYDAMRAIGMNKEATELQDELVDELSL